MRVFLLVILVLTLACACRSRVPGDYDTRAVAESGRDLWSLVLRSTEHLRNIEREIREELNATVLSGRESERYSHLPEDWIIFSVRQLEGEGENTRERVLERFQHHPFVSHLQLEQNRARSQKRIIPNPHSFAFSQRERDTLVEKEKESLRGIVGVRETVGTMTKGERIAGVTETERKTIGTKESARESEIARMPERMIERMAERMTERMTERIAERATGGMESVTGVTYEHSTESVVSRRESVKDLGQSLFSDPLYADQWHLLNTGQSEGTEGIDANVMGAWERDITGAGVQILVVDDGVQRLHPDLADNFVLESSFSFSDSSHDPTPVPTEAHGTSCAGVAAAGASNGSCGVGVAFGAALAGIEILGVTSADVDEASALTYDLAHNMVYSNSWGPVDSGAVLEAPGPRTQSALSRGVTEGRGGKGAIYVWAAGNGLEEGDNVNYDGFANSIETIAVGAVNHYGRQAYYSEPGAAMLVTAPSSGTDLGITTTDLTSTAGSDPGDCTSTFGGTSSATPVVAGTVALMLQANPELGWRDVQHLLVHTARAVDVNDADWSYNGAGLHVNHKYGFGLVDASAAVELATRWTPYPAEAETTEKSRTPSLAIPDGTGEGVELTFRIDEDVGPLEHIQLQLTASHRRASDLEVTLLSPQGTVSVLAEDHGYDMVAQLTSNVETDVGVWAQYSAPCPEEGLSGRIVAADPANGCTTLHGDYEGTIVLMERGACDFIAKSFHAQDAGAVAALVYDNTAEAPFAMAGSDPHVWLPSAMISQADGDTLLDALAALEVNDSIEGILTNVTSKPLSDPYDDWTFMSVRHWGEEGRGTWTLTVEDKFPTVSGTLTTAKIKLYGSGRQGATDEESESPLPSPGASTESSTSGDISSGNDSSDNDDESSARLWEDLFIATASLLAVSACVLLVAVLTAAAGLAAFKYRQRSQANYDIAFELKELEQSDSSALLEEEGGDPDLNPLHA